MPFKLIQKRIKKESEQRGENNGKNAMIESWKYPVLI